MGVVLDALVVVDGVVGVDEVGVLLAGALGSGAGAGWATGTATACARVMLNVLLKGLSTVVLPSAWVACHELAVTTTLCVPALALNGMRTVVMP